jgi:hypothetical protein
MVLRILKDDDDDNVIMIPFLLLSWTAVDLFFPPLIETLLTMMIFPSHHNKQAKRVESNECDDDFICELQCSVFLKNRRKERY